MHYKENFLVRQFALPMISGASWQNSAAPNAWGNPRLRRREVGGTSAYGPSLTNCPAHPMSRIGPEAEVDEYALLGFGPSS
jgi:hypothetical protein